MDEQERRLIYASLWNKLGSNYRLDIAIEEMSELIKAILKTRREGRIYSYKVSEEIADVLICFEQLEMQMKSIPFNVVEINEHSGCAYSSNLWDGQVMKIKEQKLHRLKEGHQ
jgi:hypothetical protein